uniref:hypothetical protein n=1 Tax=Paenibacillus xylanexedens TaxID=528191 RepID=UPI001C92BFD4
LLMDVVLGGRGKRNMRRNRGDWLRGLGICRMGVLFEIFGDGKRVKLFERFEGMEVDGLWMVYVGR